MRDVRIMLKGLRSLKLCAIAVVAIAGYAHGTPLRDTAASIAGCREQWNKLDGVIGRIYGPGWKTAKTPARVAEFASWPDQVFTPLDTRVREIESKRNSIQSEKQSIKSDEDLLVISMSRFKSEADALQKEIDDHNREIDRCSAAISRHNASPPDAKNASAVGAYNSEKDQLNGWRDRLLQSGEELNRRGRQMLDRASGLDRKRDAITERRSACERKESDLRENESAWNTDCNAATEKLRGAIEEFSRMSERAVGTMHALDSVSRSFTRPGHPQHGLAMGPAAQRKLEENNCKHFFLQMGAELSKSSPQAKAWAADFGQLDANSIVKKLDRLSASPGGHWSKVTADSNEALYATLQQMANSGAIVIGGSKAGETGGHGHLGFVSPTPPSLDPSKFAGSGPFVRDGNEHDFRGSTSVDQEQRRVFPSTYGAVKASKAFPLQRTTWYVWDPKLP